MAASTVTVVDTTHTDHSGVSGRAYTYADAVSGDDTTKEWVPTVPDVVGSKELNALPYIPVKARDDSNAQGHTHP